MPRLPPEQEIRQDVARALAEDVGTGDLTVDLLPEGGQLNTRVISREVAVLAGTAWFDEVFKQLGGTVEVSWQCVDGEALAPDQVICELKGDAAAILTGERTALNFIQLLSGTATATRAMVDRVAGTGTRILDTRKTLPGLRLAQKYAVLCGGGTNHRIGLFDAILIKENHIAAAGSIASAVSRAFELHPGKPVEVEVENLEELAQAHEAGAHRAMLDNFARADLVTAVKAYSGKLELEASGNVDLDSVRGIAETGVDFISTGAITKHVRAVDFSMRFV